MVSQCHKVSHLQKNCFLPSRNFKLFEWEVIAAPTYTQVLKGLRWHSVPHAKQPSSQDLCGTCDLGVPCCSPLCALRMPVFTLLGFQYSRNVSPSSSLLQPIPHYLGEERGEKSPVPKLVSFSLTKAHSFGLLCNRGFARDGDAKIPGSSVYP